MARSTPCVGRSCPRNDIPSRFAGRNILFAAHGFNVSQLEGPCSLGLLGSYLNLPSLDVFVGVLWPGDSVVPIIDYPFEGNVAQDCGGRLATFCNQACAKAQSLSFVSHSLGARLVLEAVARLDRKAQSVCLTAAAINRDCLVSEYSNAAGNASAHIDPRIAQGSRRSSRSPSASPIPCPICCTTTILPSSARSARKGRPRRPRRRCAPPGRSVTATISDTPAIRLPLRRSLLPPPPPPATQWPLAADFMMRAFADQPQTWPTP